MRIETKQCEALIVDVQERLFPHIYNNEELERNLGILINGLKQLQVPFIVTQQYTKGLGNTISSVRTALANDSGNLQYIEKISFSCCDEPTFETKLRQIDKKLLVIAGIEAHVCILQTVLDICRRGMVPILVEDCTGSRNPNDKKVAVERMKTAGAVVTTYESLLFELCRFAGTATFKAISCLVK